MGLSGFGLGFDLWFEILELRATAVSVIKASGGRKRHLAIAYMGSLDAGGNRICRDWTDCPWAAFPANEPRVPIKKGTVNLNKGEL